MVIVVKKKRGREMECELSDLIEGKLDGEDNETGAVDGAAWTARNSIKAIGRLVDTLVSKGIITLDDAKTVAGLHELDEIRIKK